MKCPIDGADLIMTDRRGIEIDYCPKCRGVWLDRGELDKIIERSEKEQSASSTNEDDRRDRRGRRNERDNDDDEGGFLGNIFGRFGRDD